MKNTFLMENYCLHLLLFDTKSSRIYLRHWVIKRYIMHRKSTLVHPSSSHVIIINHRMTRDFHTLVIRTYAHPRFLHSHTSLCRCWKSLKTFYGKVWMANILWFYDTFNALHYSVMDNLANGCIYSRVFCNHVDAKTRNQVFSDV